MEFSGAHPFELVLAPGAEPLPDAFRSVRAALHERVGVLGGATHAGGLRRFGWMLAPAPYTPLPFELVPVEAPLGERGVDALVRGPIDVVAPEMLLVRRELLAEALPADPVAATVALTARARAAGLEVVCLPAFACKAAPLGADDRGRMAALRALAQSNPELVGQHRIPPAARRLGVDRETRVTGASPVRVRRRIPPTTVLVYGENAAAAARRMRERSVAIVAARAVDDPVVALRAEMRVRGDRYVLIADASVLPDESTFDRLFEMIESADHIVLASRGALDGRCALLALARIPAHIVAEGDTIAGALTTLAKAAHGLRRGVRPPIASLVAGERTRSSVSLVFLASSTPEVAKMTFDAALSTTQPGDEIAVVCARGAETIVRIIRAFSEVRLELDDVDPLLTTGANRAIGAARNDLVVILADDIVVSPGWLDALRAAFVRLPALGAALPSVAGAPGGEGVHDVNYRNLDEMRVFAQRRALMFAREVERIDDAATPAIAVAREAFAQVGGIDPAFGPTRRGIGDLVLRLRAAGYDVVRCDDSYVHRLDAAQSRNPAAVSPHPPGAPEGAARAAAIAAGFDPVRRVPFATARPVREDVRPTTLIALPVADAVELESAAQFLAAAARTFDADSPLRVHVVLDGHIATSDAVARVRSVLAQAGRPIDEGLAVRVERSDDLGGWVASLDSDVRVVVATAHERPAFDGLPTIAAHGLGTLLRPVALR